MQLNNFTKKIFKNFILEFDIDSLNDIFLYCLILKIFVNSNNLKDLNNNLRIFLKELYLIDIKQPIQYLNY